jgi:hypothetical protein
MGGRRRAVGRQAPILAGHQVRVGAEVEHNARRQVDRPVRAAALSKVAAVRRVVEAVLPVAEAARAEAATAAAVRTEDSLRRVELE